MLPILLTRNAREPSASDLLVLHGLTGTAELSLHFPADHASNTNFAATVSSTAIPETEWDLAQKRTGGQQPVAAPSWQPHHCIPSYCHHSLLSILWEADVSLNLTGSAPTVRPLPLQDTAHSCPPALLPFPTGLQITLCSPITCSQPGGQTAARSAAAASTCSAFTLDNAEMGSVLFPLLFCFLITFHYTALLDKLQGRAQLPQPLSSLPVCSPTKGQSPSSRAVRSWGCPYPET